MFPCRRLRGEPSRKSHDGYVGNVRVQFERSKGGKVPTANRQSPAETMFDTLVVHPVISIVTSLSEVIWPWNTFP